MEAGRRAQFVILATDATHMRQLQGEGVGEPRLISNGLRALDLLQLLEERAKFCAIVLPAVCGGPVVCGGVADHSATAGEPGPSKRVLTLPALVSSTCPLQLLRGHEDTLLALVADFAGVPHGRKLRTLREAVQCLEDDADDEADYDEEIPGSLLPFSAAGAAWS